MKKLGNIKSTHYLCTRKLIHFVTMKKTVIKQVSSYPIRTECGSINDIPTFLLQIQRPTITILMKPEHSPVPP
jgi:hypothetical protein